MSRASEERVTVLALTTAEAIALVKASERTKGTRFFAHVKMDALIVDEPDKCFRDGCWGSLRLSKADAAHLLSRMLTPELEARGGRIPVTRRAYPDDALWPGQISYWIG